MNYIYRQYTKDIEPGDKYVSLGNYDDRNYTHTINLNEISHRQIKNNVYGDVLKIEYVGDEIPKHVIGLKFEYKFNFNTTKKISIANYNRCYDFDLYELSKNLLYLTFDDKFNNDVDNLSDTLIELKFGDSFNQNINKYPKILEKLIFGDCFNKEINSLPETLTHLQFGDKFNKSIKNLPNSIKHLYLGIFFRKNINKLPNSIENLTINGKIVEKIENLPYSLKHLFLDDDYDYNFSKYRNIDIKVNANILPPLLEYFNTNKYFNNSKNKIYFNNLPSKLKSLSINHNYSKNINNLPYSLKTISIYSNHKNNYLNKLPSSINYLIYDATYQIKHLPHTITELMITERYNKNLDFIPESIKVLRLLYYAKPINDLPSSIEKIYLIGVNKNLINKMYWHKIVE